MAARFNDVVDDGYEADADCPKSTSSRGLDALVMLEDPLGLRLAKRRTTSRRGGIFRKFKPRSLEIRQGRLQPQPQQPPPQDAVEEAPPSQEPPANVPSVEEPPFVVPPFASSSVLPVPTPSATLPEPESESSSSSESDGEDSPSPTTSTFPPGISAPSQTTIGSPSATDSLTSRPVAEGAFDPSRQAQDPTLGIAFGSVGAGAIVICLVFSIWFLCRYRRKKRKSMAPPSSMPPNTNSYMVQANLPPDRGPPRRSPSSLMDELMAAAYDVENGAQADQQSPAPHGYLNEKRYDPSQQLPILQPAPVVQPTVRWSIASWVRRHNPLKLNPVNGRNSMYSTTSSASRSGTPPVPAMPAQFQSRGQPSEGDNEPLVPPPLVVPRVASSHYSEAGGNGQSPISVYARNSGTWFQRNLVPGRSQQQQQQQQQLPQQQQHHFFNARAVSMAQTEHTTTNMSESTWASWGAGVSRPQQPQQQPPETPRRAWIEKCVKLGGWK